MKQLFQLCRFSKKLLLPAIAFISLTASAQSALQKHSAETRSIALNDPYDDIWVVGDVKIVLTNNLDGQVVFQGDHRSIEVAKATIKNRRLMIDIQRKTSLTPLTVYLPVSNIRLLETSGETEIYSSGTVKVSELEILLNGHSNISIKHDGKLKITPGTGYELSYSKN